MTPSARLAAAAEILDTWLAGYDAPAGDQKPTPIDVSLSVWGRANRYAGSKDRAAIADRVYGCLRRMASLGGRMGARTGRALVLGSLREIDAMTPEEIGALAADGRYGIGALEAAELAALSDTPDLPAAQALDWPEWLLSEAQRAFGPALQDELSAMRDRAPVDLRVNRLKADRDSAMAALAAEGVAALPHPLSPDALRCAPGTPVARTRAYLDGLVELQDAASQAAALMAAAAPGETVLDYCAGGGGKTLALAAQMQGRGRLIAHDVAPARMRDLPERAQRAGAHGEMIDTQDLEELRDACDLVYVDAPCSGSGSWRRDPEGKWRLTPEALAHVQAAQIEALTAAAAYVRPGGRLVYATCSILPCENADQVAGFLAAHSGFSLKNSASYWPARDGADGFYCASLHKS